MGPFVTETCPLSVSNLALLGRAYHREFRQCSFLIGKALNGWCVALGAGLTTIFGYLHRSGESYPEKRIFRVQRWKCHVLSVRIIGQVGTRSRVCGSNCPRVQGVWQQRSETPKLLIAPSTASFTPSLRFTQAAAVAPSSFGVLASALRVALLALSMVAGDRRLQANTS